MEVPVILIILMCSGFAFAAGIFYERTQWNELIEKKIIPPPKKLK